MASPMFIVEARDEAGRIVPDPKSPPPFSTASARQLEEYHAEHTGNVMAELTEQLAWFKSQGWHCRRRGW